MYPNLLVPLLGIGAAVLLALLVVAVRRPVARRLAGRQLARRPAELMLAAAGATLGVAIIAGALVVGDTLNFSVRQQAYRTLGPVDERIVSTSSTTGRLVADQLRGLTRDSRVDGVLSARYVQAAASAGTPGGSGAEPRAVVWAVNFAAAERFGAAGGGSGLSGATPGRREVVINQPLADSLHAEPGTNVTLFMFGRPHVFAVSRVLPEQGLAGAGPSSSDNENAYVDPAWFPSSLLDQDQAQVVPVTVVSNRGGVQGGAAGTDDVLIAIHNRLGALAATAVVDAPKRDVLDAAQRTGDSLGALFLMIGSFSIIAGALLLVNIFVMLGDERKGQFGMLRAVGMRRATLVGALTLEGAVYSLGALVPGIALGVGVGWAVARIAAQIFRSFGAPGTTMSIAFSVTPTSLLNAAALGFLIGVTAIFLTSVRISRLNVIAAIRDLGSIAPPEGTRRQITIACTALCIAFAAAAVPAVATSQAEGSYLFPSLAAAMAIPLLRRVMSARAAVSWVAGSVLVWSLVLPEVRPRLFDHASMTVFVVEGCLVAFAGVSLVSQNQEALLAPVRAMRHRSADNALAARLAVAYPIGRRFRTGATLVMYTLVTLVLVLLVEVAGVLDNSVETNVAQATAGYDLRIEVNPARSAQTLAALRQDVSGGVARVTTLTTASALTSDPGHRTDRMLSAIVTGVRPGAVTSMTFDTRLPGKSTDAAVWRLIASDQRYVAIDTYYGSSGGPPGSYFSPGDEFTVVDAQTGIRQTKIIAGILTSSMIFYPQVASGSVFPVVESTQAVESQFRNTAVHDTALVRLRAGVDPENAARLLQARYLRAGLVATAVGPAVRSMFSANVAFFRLLQGFLALGLVVGIAGLGVIMIRAVRERRRTIGVLRALGVQARTMRRSFLLESGLIALEGVLLGSVLGVLTTWLMYQKSAMFETIRTGFPVEWITIGVLLVATLVLSLVATVVPARRAAAILPALAVRIAD